MVTGDTKVVERGHGDGVYINTTGIGVAPTNIALAPLHDLVAAMLASGCDIHMLRDLTRGGLAAAANEIAHSAGVGLVIDEPCVPVQPAVTSACEILGLDPFQVANEGKLLAIVPPDAADAVLAAMRQHPFGHTAAIIGEVTEHHPGVVVGRTGIGSQRVIDLPAGELLPRIC